MEKVLPQMFRPELLNRFDRVIACTPLSPESVREIARRMMLTVAKKLKAEKGITLESTEEAIDEIAEKGYHPMYGARPLRRVLQDTVDSALARLLLEHHIGRRDIVIMQKGGIMEVRSEELL
jgi:ATP-dependent Clp protease ATP-binding subunit ClpA